MTYTGKSKFVRRTISWCLTILLFLIFIGITIYLSAVVASNEPTKVNCPNDKSTITSAEVIADWQLGDNKEGVGYCYCTHDFANRLNENFTVGSSNV